MTEGLEHSLTKDDFNTERKDHISILVHYEDFLGTVRLVRDGDFGCYFKNKFLPF